MDNVELKEFIKQIIKEEFLEEMTTSAAYAGGEGPIKTPHAFGKKKKRNESETGETPRMQKIAKHSMPDRDSNIVDKHHPARVDEARAKYYNFRESSEFKKNSSKVSYVIAEIKKMLKEVDYLAKISNRLKTESDVTSDAYWKKSQKDLTEISAYTRSIAKRMGGLQ